MKTITVSASKTYDIIVGSGLLSELPARIGSLNTGEKIMVISDSNVWPIYADRICTLLNNAGFEVFQFIFEAGEKSKTPETYLAILNHLTQCQFTRSDLLIALGGGVVGDMTGFVAATYLRGISCIQIPTSLLAMVDSSVGGKTAIDLPAGKNLVGAFYQPDLVICDIDMLSSLPGEIFRDGCAEVIKYGVLYDPSLFAHLLSNGLNFDREYVISRCIELKRDVVTEDEFDTGARQKLNLGHTIGHGIEAAGDYRVTHGQAVAIGVAIITRAAAQLHICTEQTSYKIMQILDLFSLPAETSYSADVLYHFALSDKKRTGQTVKIIVPKEIGNCEITSVPIDKLQSIIEAGL